MVTTWRSDVYHLILLCRIRMNVTVEFSASECLLLYFLKPLCYSNLRFRFLMGLFEVDWLLQWVQMIECYQVVLQAIS